MARFYLFILLTLSATVAAAVGQVAPYRPLNAVFHPESPDRLLILEKDGRVGLWQSSGGRHDRLLTITTNAHAACFTPDGAGIITGGLDGKVRRWHINGQLEWESNVAHSEVVTAVTAARGRIASGSLDGSIYLWGLEDGVQKELESSTGPASRVMGLDLSSTEPYLAVAHEDGSIVLRHLDTKIASPIHRSLATMLAVKFAPSGRWFAAVGEDRYLYRWHISGEMIGRPLVHQGAHSFEGAYASAISFLDEESLLTTGIGGQIYLWRLVSRDLQQMIFLGEREVAFNINNGANFKTISVSADGSRLVTIGSDNVVYFWSSDGRSLRHIYGHRGMMGSVSILAEERVMAVLRDNELSYWRLSDLGKPIVEPLEIDEAEYGGEIHRIQFSVGGTLGVVGDRGWCLLPSFMAQAMTCYGAESELSALALSPDVDRVAVVAHDAFFVFSEPSDPALSRSKQYRSVRFEALGARDVDFSPDGSLLAVGCDDGSVVFFRLPGGERFSSQGESVPVKTVAFSPSGAMALAGQSTGALMLVEFGEGTRQIHREFAPIAVVEESGFLEEDVFWARFESGDLAFYRVTRESILDHYLIEPLNRVTFQRGQPFYIDENDSNVMSSEAALGQSSPPSVDGSQSQQVRRSAPEPRQETSNPVVIILEPTTAEGEGNQHKGQEFPENLHSYWILLIFMIIIVLVFIWRRYSERASVTAADLDPADTDPDFAVADLDLVDAIEAWNEKISFMLAEEAKTTDPNQKWTISFSIREARQKIASLQQLRGKK